MTEMHTWGSLIRERRKALGLTQVGLAERLGVTQATVSGWEIGTRNPGTAQATIIRELGITPDELHAVVAGAAA